MTFLPVIMTICDKVTVKLENSNLSFYQREKGVRFRFDNEPRGSAFTEDTL